MSIQPAAPPGLVVLDGPMRGAGYPVPFGRSEIGRHAEDGIRLDDGTVSRRHAAVERVGQHVLLTDLGSINGTRVNGSRVVGAVELHDGDIVRLGAVSLRFAALVAEPTGYPGSRFPLVAEPARSTQPLQTTGVGQAAVWDEGAGDEGAGDAGAGDDGVGRALMLAGFCVAMVGFGVWMYFIFATFAADPSAITNPFARELVPGLPLAAVGLAVFAAGGVVAGLGASMSRPVRRSAVTEWTARPRSAARPRRAGSSGSRRPGPAPG